MGIHENLIQTFTNFKNKFIGNIGNSTVAALLNGKQNSTDNSLNTTSKTVVGAINELNSDLADVETTISAKAYPNIPASQTNFLRGAVVQRKSGAVCQLKFGGFKNLVTGQDNIVVTSLSEALKPEFDQTWKVSDSSAQYQIQVRANGTVGVFPYGAITSQANLNPTLVYLSANID